MRSIFALCLLVALSAPCAAAPQTFPPGGPGELVLPPLPNLPPGAVQTPTVMPPGMTEVAYNNAIADAGRTGFAFRNFAFLEQKAQGYRDAHSRTPMGEWELDLFYRGIGLTKTLGDRADDAGFVTAEAEAQDWVNAYPASPTPRIAYAWLLIQHGWMFDYLATSEEGATPAATRALRAADAAQAHDTFKKASDYLVAHKDIAAADPNWYVMMLRVAWGDGWDDAAAWRIYDEARQLHPEYMPIYYSFLDYVAANAKNAQQLPMAIQVAVAHAQGQSGNEIYARLYTHLTICGCDGGNPFANAQAEWWTLRQSLEEIARKWPDPWAYDEEFYYACQAGDRPTAILALGKITSLPEPAPVWREGERGACELWAAGRAPDSPFVPSRDPTPALLVGTGYFLRLFAALLSLFV